MGKELPVWGATEFYVFRVWFAIRSYCLVREGNSCDKRNPNIINLHNWKEQQNLYANNPTQSPKKDNNING